MKVISDSPFSGAVLAGGRSSRFGQDKARYLYENQALTVWVLESLRLAAERFIVANKPYDFGVPVYPDIHPGSSLGGLHAALTHANHDWVALAACDMPFLTPEYWQSLAAQREGVSAVVVERAGRLEPLAALYHKNLLPLAEAQLEAGHFRMRELFELCNPCILPWENLGIEEKTLFNANYLDDLP